MDKKLSFRICAALSLLAIIFYFSACKDNAVTTQANNLEASYTSTADTVDHVGILILDTVKLLLKDIKLNVATTNDTNNFKTGSFVLFLNLNPNVSSLGTTFIPSGTYDKVKFEVHKLNINEPVPDPEFIDSVNSYSVVAKGIYNGVWFDYKSDKSAHMIISFPGSLFVSSSGMTNITLKIYPYIWFIDANGLYLDPNDPNNHSTIDNNIKDNINNNFKAFKDNDKNGVPDTK